MEEEVKQEEKKEQTPDEKPLDKMTATELREIAKAIPGVEGAHAMKKEELLAVVKEYRGAEDKGPKKRKKAAKSGRTVSQLKQKISQLKEEKASAREANDKEKVKTLRRRINRTKKLVRKVAQG